MLTIEIINSGTGTDESANYHYRVYVNVREIARGKVEGHNRADEWWKLLDRIVKHASSGTAKIDT